MKKVKINICSPLEHLNSKNHLLLVSRELFSPCSTLFVFSRATKEAVYCTDSLSSSCVPPSTCLSSSLRSQPGLRHVPCYQHLSLHVQLQLDLLASLLLQFQLNISASFLHFQLKIDRQAFLLYRLLTLLNSSLLARDIWVWDKGAAQSLGEETGGYNIMP